MTPISARVILHTKNPNHDELITLELTYPRLIHSEVMTYGSIAKVSASSRAIPLATYRAKVQSAPALPVYWGKNQAGMQAKEELTDTNLSEAQRLWLEARDSALMFHEALAGIGLHKQIANRLLEAWAPHTMAATANLEAWEHLLFERTDSDAQPEFMALANAIEAALLPSIPKRLAEGQWHTPYMREDDFIEIIAREKRLESIGIPLACRISAARVARTSYLNQNGIRDLDDDLKLFDRLVPAENDARPGHWSPLEGVAQALSTGERSGRFVGYKQLRKFYPRENEQKKIKRVYPHPEECRAAKGTFLVWIYEGTGPHIVESCPTREAAEKVCARYHGITTTTIEAL